MWRLSSTVYKEISFQSIFYLRAGSALTRSGSTDIERLVRNARMNTLISKLLTTVFIAIFGFVVFLPLTGFMPSATSLPPKDVAFRGGISAFLAVLLFLIVFMGLQVSTAFVSSKIADVLSALPLSTQDVSNIIFLCFLRMFDIPLIAAAAVFLAAYFLVGGSILGGLLSVVAIAISEIFALALTIGLSRFFYSRVAGGGGRSRWQTLLRAVFMVVWIIPIFGAYIVTNFAGSIVQSFASLASAPLVLVYPFSYGYLVTCTIFPKVVDYFLLSLSITASIAYAFLAVLSFRWVTRTVRAIGGGGIVARQREIVKDTVIKPQTPWLGIIRKDLRIASRAPSYASLFLLPAMQTVILALSFSSSSGMGLSVTLGTLTGISLITLLLPPTLLSMEGLASAYTRSLPLKKRTLISAKTLLSIITYLISLIVLFLVAAYLHSDFFILTYAATHALAVSAGIMLELTILTRKFWKEGFSVGNIYTRMTTYVLILIPGFAIVMLPIITALVAFFFVESLAFPVFFAMASSEFAVMTAVVAAQK
jgi:hypothetical protein